MSCMQSYLERNTTFVMNKACALRIFAGAVLSGYGIMESCNLAAKCTLLSSRTIWQWANDVFGDFFSIVSNLDDISDEKLEMELQSGRGKHPKWVSLMMDEGFKQEVREYVLENGYVKGRPNLTLQQLVTWIKDTYCLDVCTSTVSLWLHDMGFSYKQFSKGVYFDGHERKDVVEERKTYLANLLHAARDCGHPTHQPQTQCVVLSSEYFTMNLPFTQMPIRHFIGQTAADRH